MQQGLTRYGILTIEEMRNLRKTALKGTVRLQEFNIDLYIKTPQLNCFFTHGFTCAEPTCSIEGTYFGIEKYQSVSKDRAAHARLYGKAPNGEEIELTLDHIVARGLGGHSTSIDNHQTLCQLHNNLKSKWEQEMLREYSKCYDFKTKLIAVLEKRYGRHIYSWLVN